MKVGKRPTIFGDGTKARDYVYVEDVVRANVIALRRGKNEIVNLGRGEIVTDKRMFDTIARALGFKEKPIYAPYRRGEIYRISLDARRAWRVLGWKAKVPLGDGIRVTVKTI